MHESALCTNYLQSQRISYSDNVTYDNTTFSDLMDSITAHINRVLYNISIGIGNEIYYQIITNSINGASIFLSTLISQIKADFLSTIDITGSSSSIKYLIVMLAIFNFIIVVIVISTLMYYQDIPKRISLFTLLPTDICLQFSQNCKDFRSMQKSSEALEKNRAD